MEYELRIIPDCPNSDAAQELFQRVLAADGAPGDLHVVEITSDDDAAALNFHGSPSFVANGHDLFPSTAAPALTCRIYHTGDRMAGLPSPEDLAAAVREVAARP